MTRVQNEHTEEASIHNQSKLNFSLQGDVAHIWLFEIPSHGTYGHV